MPDKILFIETSLIVPYSDGGLVIALGYWYCRDHAACEWGQQAEVRGAVAQRAHSFSAKRNGACGSTASTSSLRAKRSNPGMYLGKQSGLLCFASLAMTEYEARTECYSDGLTADRVEAPFAARHV
jgi:hypothetical protein